MSRCIINNNSRAAVWILLVLTTTVQSKHHYNGRKRVLEIKSFSNEASNDGGLAFDIDEKDVLDSFSADRILEAFENSVTFALQSLSFSMHFPVGPDEEPSNSSLPLTPNTTLDSQAPALFSSLAPAIATTLEPSSDIGSFNLTDVLNATSTAIPSLNFKTSPSSAPTQRPSPLLQVTISTGNTSSVGNSSEVDSQLIQTSSSSSSQWSSGATAKMGIAAAGFLAFVALAAVTRRFRSPNGEKNNHEQRILEFARDGSLPFLSLDAPEMAPTLKEERNFATTPALSNIEEEEVEYTPTESMRTTSFSTNNTKQQFHREELNDNDDDNNNTSFYDVDLNDTFSNGNDNDFPLATTTTTEQKLEIALREGNWSSVARFATALSLGNK